MLSLRVCRRFIAGSRQADTVLQRNSSSQAEGNQRSRWANKIGTLSSTSVWTEFTPLAVKHGAVNLGQGFPDFPADDWLLDATAKAVQNNMVQYTRSPDLRLVNALSKVYSPLFNREIDPLKEVLVTVGATEAIFIAMQAFLNPGDECILFEPFYDSYPPSVRMAGGVPVSVPLRPRGNGTSSTDWVLDRTEFERSLSSKTKMILINNPMNVPGKVWDISDLEYIAKVAQERDLIVISDEVYEWMVYDGLKHTKIATLPGMWDRTLTIGSAGKSFSVTGYKVGWLMGPFNLIEALNCVHQNTTFSVATPLQEGIAIALEQVEARKYFETLRSMFLAKRDRLVSVLKEVGLNPVVPQGSYFILGNTSNIDDKHFFDPSKAASRDFQFCRWLTEHVGVAAIPPSAFFSEANKHIPADYARFAFCKKDESFEMALQRLQKLKQLKKN